MFYKVFHTDVMTSKLIMDFYHPAAVTAIYPVNEDELLFILYIQIIKYQ